MNSKKYTLQDIYLQYKHKLTLFSKKKDLLTRVHA